MNKYLMIVCAVAAFVGCAQHRGGMRDSDTTTSGSYDRNMNTSTNWNSSTNGSQGIRGNNSGIPDRSNSAENGALKN